MTVPRDIPDEAVGAFGDVLYEYGYDIAGFTRVSPTEVRYEQAGTTPAFETVRAALAAALPFLSAERDALLARAEAAEARADKLAKALMYFAQFDREHDGVPDEDTFYGFVGAAQDALADATTEARDRDTEARDELDADVQQGLRDIEDEALHSFEEAFGEPQVARDRDTEKEEG